MVNKRFAINFIIGKLLKVRGRERHSNGLEQYANAVIFCARTGKFKLLTLKSLAIFPDVHQHDKVVVCYVASWAAYRPGKLYCFPCSVYFIFFNILSISGNGAFTWENIDPTLCTHIIYSFAGLDNETYEMKSLDPFLDLEKDGGKGQYSKIINLKAKQPDLKVTVAIGGWNEGSEKYSAMAMTPQSRRKFIDSALNFTRYNKAC